MGAKMTGRYSPRAESRLYRQHPGSRLPIKFLTTYEKYNTVHQDTLASMRTETTGTHVYDPGIFGYRSITFTKICHKSSPRFDTKTAVNTVNARDDAKITSNLGLIPIWIYDIWQPGGRCKLGICKLE